MDGGRLGGFSQVAVRADGRGYGGDAGVGEGAAGGQKELVGVGGGVGGEGAAGGANLGDCLLGGCWGGVEGEEISGWG